MIRRTPRIVVGDTVTARTVYPEDILVTNLLDYTDQGFDDVGGYLCEGHATDNRYSDRAVWPIEIDEVIR